MASGPLALAEGTSGLRRASGSPSSLAVMLSSCTRSGPHSRLQPLMPLIGVGVAKGLLGLSVSILGAEGLVGWWSGWW